MKLYKFTNGTKNIVFNYDGMTCVADNPDWFYDIIPQVEKVEVFDGVSRKKKNNGRNVVKLTFNDDTVETAILADGDTFSLENGISICITKRLLRDICPDNESSVYNKLIQMALKVYQDGIAEKKEKKRKGPEKQYRNKPKHKKIQEDVKDYQKELMKYLRKCDDEDSDVFGNWCF